MCGIAGVVGWKDVEDGVNRTMCMLNSLSHRGPDDYGTEIVQFPGGGHPITVLGHRRLSIIDTTSAGHQPMFDQTFSGEGAWLSFNGEVYNYRELKPALESSAVGYRGDSDSEVLLRAWQKWGSECLEKLNGMFAFAVADLSRRKVSLVRDRMGIKPLYYVQVPGKGLAFASEVQALVEGLREIFPMHLDGTGLCSFLAQGYVAEPGTLVKGIRMLPPGHFMDIDLQGQPGSPRSYWDLKQEPGIGEDALRDALQDAVRLRLRSDVPLAVFLSSGLDSSLIASLASLGDTDVLKTITIGFDGLPEFDESPAAGRISSHLGTDNLKVSIDNDFLLESFGQFLGVMDQPTVDGFNSYVICRRAREAGFKVVLSGLGGDELFAGYATFRDVPKLMRLGPLARLLGLASGMMSHSRAQYKLAHLKSPRPLSLVSLYFLRREVFLSSERESLLAQVPDGIDLSLGLPQSFLGQIEFLANASGGDVVNRISRIEMAAYMRNMLLRDNDVFSMAHGLELRVPFLDHRVVQQALSFPGSAKLAGSGIKPFMQKVFREEIPPHVLTTEKKGFAFPWKNWLAGPLREHVEDAVSDTSTWEGLGMRSGAVRETWDRFRSGDSRILPLQVLAFVTLANLQRKYRLTL